MLAVLEHIDHETAKRLLNEINRVLKPDGCFILTTPSPLGNNVLKIMAKLMLVSKEEIEEHKKIYSLKELRQILPKYGFSLKNSGSFELFMNSYACAIKSSS
jgi:SAM-dependent methyltransferase